MISTMKYSQLLLIPAYLTLSACASKPSAKPLASGSNFSVPSKFTVPAGTKVSSPDTTLTVDVTVLTEEWIQTQKAIGLLK